MIKQYKICIFCEKWESGGIESFLYNVLTHMDLAALNVDIVVSELGSSVFTDRLRNIGIRFIELSGSQRNVFDNHRLFRKLLRERHYDAVHVNLFHALSLFYIKMAFDIGVPLRIAHSHNTSLRSSNTKRLKLIVHNCSKRLLTRYATDLWACSKTAAKFCFAEVELKGRGFRFIPNGINLKKYYFDASDRTSVRDELNLTGQFVVGHVGRMCDQKNQLFLLDIFARIAARRPESFLLLVGDGEYKDALRKKAACLGLSDNVIFYGTTTRPELLYKAMDVFVFPSKFEGFGIAALEAQASGLPVICSDKIPEEVLVTPDIVRIPLNGNADLWSSAVFRLEKPSENRTDIPDMSVFDIDKVAEAIAEHYRGAAKNDRTSESAV